LAEFAVLLCENLKLIAGLSETRELEHRLTSFLGQNISSLQARRGLNGSSDRLSRIYERLSSGQRINRASDDAAGLSLSSTLAAQSRVKSQGIRNANDAISLFNIADATLGSLKQIVERMQELANQAANGVFTSEQRGALDVEATELELEYSRILESTQFNNRSIFEATEADLSVQLGGNFIELDTLEYSENIVSYTGLGTYSTANSISLGMFASDYDQVGYVVKDINGDGFDDYFGVFASAADFGTEVSVELRTLISDGIGSFTSDSATIFSNVTSTIQGSFTAFEIEVNSSSVNLVIVTDQQDIVNLTTTISGSNIGALTAGGSVSVDESSDGNAVTIVNDDGVNDRSIRSGNGLLIQTQDTSSSVSAGFVEIEVPSITLTSQSSAKLALTRLAQLSDSLSRLSGQIGANTSRVLVASNVLEVARVEVEAAKSRVMDVDVAQESAALTAEQIRQEVASAVLAQANIQPSIATALLGDVNA
jgi:flagellin